MCGEGGGVKEGACVCVEAYAKMANIYKSLEEEPEGPPAPVMTGGGGLPPRPVAQQPPPEQQYQPAPPSYTEQPRAVATEYRDDPTQPPPESRRQRVDANGEPIIAEGYCSRRRVCMQICSIYFLLAACTCFILLPFMCFLGFFMGQKAASSWELYLTPTGIHYTRVGASTCCIQKMFIALEDIDDVFVQETIVVRSNGGPTTHSHSVKLRINPERVEEYLPWSHRKIFMQTEYMELIYVENASDFANAVKRQIAANNARRS